MKDKEWKKICILVLCSMIFMYLFMKNLNIIEGLSDSNTIMSYSDEQLRMKTCSDSDNFDSRKVYNEEKLAIEDNEELFITELKTMIESSVDGNYMIVSSIYQILQQIFRFNQYLKRYLIQYKLDYIKMNCKKDKKFIANKSKFKAYIMKSFKKNPNERSIRNIAYYIRRRLKFKLELLRFIDLNKKYLDSLGDKFKKVNLIKKTEIKEVDTFIDKLEDEIKKNYVDEIQRDKTYNETKEQEYTKQLLEGKLSWWDRKEIDKFMMKVEDLNLDILNLGYKIPQSLSGKEDITEEEAKPNRESGTSSTLQKDLEESNRNIKRNSAGLLN